MVSYFGLTYASQEDTIRYTETSCACSQRVDIDTNINTTRVILLLQVSRDLNLHNEG